MIDKWLELKIKNISICKILYALKPNKIAIYGYGRLAEYLYQELKSGFEDIYVTDDYDKLNDADIVIIIDYENYYKHEANMPSKACIMSIRELIGLTYFIFIHIPKLSQLGNGCKKYIVRIPQLNVECDCKNQFEYLISNMPFNLSVHKNNPAYFKYLYNDIAEYSDEYIKNIFTEIPIFKRVTGELVYSDYRSKYLNTVNGERFTYYQPEEYMYKLYLFGDCSVFGIGTDDEHTIASYIQKYIKNGKVINYGMYGAGTDENYLFQKSEYYNYNHDDIIIIFNKYSYLPVSKKSILFSYVQEILNSYGIIYCDMMNVYDMRGDNPIFIDKNHINHRGYSLIADYLYNKYLKEIDDNITQTEYNNKFVANNSYNINNVSIDSKCINDIQPYLSYLKEEQFIYDKSKKYGCIVMNANPFTNGHKYLVEQALKYVDYLYVFVLEEDSSLISFKDRFNMVALNLQHIDNVKVLRSGSYIISSITFPEYFTKEFKKEITVDTSLDVRIFAEIIAPTLHITWRFIGEEPFCKITKQYNNALKEILPQYNIKITEIERFEINGKAISATEVRKLFRERQYDKLIDLVTEQTIDYMKNNIETNLW